MDLSHAGEDEKHRLSNLYSYSILDTPPEVSFDQLAKLASSICETPIALISFIDTDRQWFKSAVGMEITELPRHLSACNQTLVQDDVYEIPDAYQNHCPYGEFMKGEGLRFYTGVPIRTREGHNIGALCVIDYKPRTLLKVQLKNLKIISKQITGLLEIRKKYLQNLERLQEVSDATYHTDRQVQDLAHKASMRAMAELSAGLSHRIRPHIIAIQSAVEKSHANDKEKIILNASSNIASIVESMEKFISTEKEKSMRPFDLSVAVDKVLDHMEWKIKKYEISLSVHKDSGLVTIGNESQIKEAIIEVLDNAIDAVEHMKVKIIEIKLYEDNHEAIIEVKDSGIGVSETIKPFIFQPFFTTKGNHHLGMGLSYSLGILQRHSGDIRLVKSCSPTTFQIVVPRP